MAKMIGWMNRKLSYFSQVVKKFGQLNMILKQYWFIRLLLGKKFFLQIKLSNCNGCQPKRFTFQATIMTKVNVLWCTKENLQDVRFSIKVWKVFQKKCRPNLDEL